MSLCHLETEEFVGRWATLFLSCYLKCFFLFVLFAFMCMSVCMYICTPHVCLCRSEESVWMGQPV